MFCQHTVAHFLGAAISIIDAFDFEEILKLILEGNRDLEELDSTTAQRTLKIGLIRVGVVAVTLPSFNAYSAEYIATLGAFLGLSEQVLANLAHKVVY